MNWINLQVSIIRAPAYVGSTPVERATWFNVLAYSIECENRGRIARGALWKDRQWQQAAGVTIREVRAASKLLSIDGDDVVVAFYPTEKEEQVRAKRIQASAAANARWEKASRNAPRIAPCNASRNAEGEEKGEGELKEKHAGAVVEFPGAELALTVSESDRPAKPDRPQDVLFEALAKAEGSDPAQLTKVGARTIAVALAEIRRATPNVTVAEINGRAVRYRRVMGVGCTLTAAALAKHWAKCSGGSIALSRSTPPPSEPAGWQHWLESQMPATDEDGPRSQLLAAKNLQSFTMMPASWQERCRAELAAHGPSVRVHASG